MSDTSKLVLFKPDVEVFTVPNYCLKKRPLYCDSKGCLWIVCDGDQTIAYPYLADRDIGSDKDMFDFAITDVEISDISWESFLKTNPADSILRKKLMLRYQIYLGNHSLKLILQIRY